MRYPPQFIDTIRNHFRISEVIGKRIPVKKRGREYMACCPFHHEKTPSFTINDEKGFYHCFGCGVHGDVINFVKDYEKIHYKEAIERLANEAGIALPELTKEDKEEFDRTTRLYQTMESAANWFSDQLKNAPAARDARDYLNRRGIRAQTIEQFQLGFAPMERNALHHSFMQRGIPAAMLEELGLIVKREDGSLQDKYRDRIQFPIHDRSGKVIAFGGRRMKSEEESKAPKYLNSPDTPLFKKSYVLYNFHRARKYASTHQQLIICEGYMDVIALAQAGFEGAVAPLGTAVTPEQLNLAWSMVDEPIMCLDGDKAGERAMLRAAETALPLIRAGKSLRFCILPEGEDPDSLILNQGRGAMEAALAQCIPLVEVLWRHHYLSRSLETPEQRAGAQQALLHAVSQITDETVREHYKSEMLSRVKRGHSSQNATYEGELSTPRTPRKGNFNKTHVPSAIPKALPASTDNKAQEQQCYHEMLTLLYYAPELLHRSDVENTLTHMELRDKAMQALQQALTDALHQMGEQVPSKDAILAHVRAADIRQNLFERLHINHHINLLKLHREKEPELKVRLAQQRWEEYATRLQQVHITLSHLIAQRTMGQTGTEDSLVHFLEVSKQARRPHEDALWYGEDDA